MKLTPAQKACLQRADLHGAAWHNIGTKQRAGGAYARMCAKLVQRGLLDPKAPYAITAEGRKAVVPASVLLAELESSQDAQLKTEYRRGYFDGARDANLNAAIRKVCDDVETYPEVADFGGKTIRYWGWYWRDVRFSDDGCRLASDTGTAEHAGFCERDKWGYPLKWVTGRAWATIVKAACDIEAALSEEMNAALADLNKALSDAWDATP